MDIEKLAQEIAEDFFRPPPDGIVYNDGPRNTLRETLADHITRHLAAWAKERDEMERLHECEGGVKKWIWQFLSQVN